MPGCTFYCVADAAYFVGAAALINSLRVVGHDERVVVLDCGLEPGQRDRLSREATILSAPAKAPRPSLLKWIAPQAAPDDVMIHLDTDVVVLRRLDEIIRQAAAGRLVAFRDISTRRFDEWATVAGVTRVGRHPYINAGFVAFPGAKGLALLEHVGEIHRRVSGVAEDAARDWRSPFFLRDQDTLNAAMAADCPEGTVVVLEQRLAPSQPFRGLRLHDRDTLDFRYADGEQPYLLHHFYGKPWLAYTAPNHYSRLLPRLLLAGDVPIRLTPDELPYRLRPGLAEDAVRTCLLVPWLVTKARFKARLIVRQARASLAESRA
jgi:hypothetical protein